MIKALLIGLGNIGMQYDIDKPQDIIITHAKALKRIKGIKLTGAVDREYNKVRTFEKNYEIEAYTDISKAMEKTSPELIVIASPTRLHYNIIKEVSEYKTTKYILCEKPMGLNYNEAEKITKICEKHNNKLWVNYIRRADKATKEIKRIIDHEWSGKNIKGVCWYTNGIRNNGLHFIDLCKYWLGDIEKTQQISQARLDYNQRDLDCCIEFEKGSMIFRYLWEETFTHYSIELISPFGRIYYGQGGEKIEIQQLAKSERYHNEVNLGRSRELEDSMIQYQLKIYEQLKKEINGEGKILCSGSEAVSYHWHVEKMMENK